MAVLIVKLEVKLTVLDQWVTSPSETFLGSTESMKAVARALNNIDKVEYIDYEIEDVELTEPDEPQGAPSS